jgi:Ca2+-binding EF-hand superfamily protein
MSYFKTDSKLREAFSKIDLDSSGHITVDEFRVYLDSLKHDKSQVISDSMLHLIFNQVDTDKDGKLSYEGRKEFIKL